MSTNKTDNTDSLATNSTVATTTTTKRKIALLPFYDCSKCRRNFFLENVAEGEEPARLQKRGVPSNTIFRPPPPVFQSPQPKRTHENSRVFPQPGDTNVFVHVEQPPRPGHPPPRPGQQPPRPGQQPHRPGQGPWAGNSKTHAPGAPKGNKPNTQGTGRGCSCREKSCPSHPCRQGGVLEVVKIKTWQNKPKSPARNGCPCWDRNCPSHPCKNPHQRPVAEPWD